MASNNDVVEVVEVKKAPSTFASNMSVLSTPEGIQKYILGTKKNGAPRALYDIVKDYTKPKNKKKKDKKPVSAYDLYLGVNKKKKKKKKKNKSKYWHI